MPSPSIRVSPLGMCGTGNDARQPDATYHWQATDRVLSGLSGDARQLRQSPRPDQSYRPSAHFAIEKSSRHRRNRLRFYFWKQALSNVTKQSKRTSYHDMRFE